MYTYSMEREQKNEVIIDIANIEKLEEHKWGSTCINGDYYVMTTIDGKKVYLNHFLYNQKVPRGKLLIYKNKNTLDNREKNLIVAGREYIQQNMKLSKANTSGIKGVRYVPRERKWEARLYHRGKVYASMHRTKFNAAKARKKMEEEIWRKGK